MSESMTGENRPWSEIFHEKADEFVELDAAAQLLEDTKSALLAQKCAEQGDIPVNRAEQNVKASRDWHDHITKIVEARKLANKAKLELEYIRMKANEFNNQEANARLEMRMTT